jgi:hypothetical protein
MRSAEQREGVEGVRVPLARDQLADDRQDRDRFVRRPDFAPDAAARALRHGRRVEGFRGNADAAGEEQLAFGTTRRLSATS